MMEEDMDDAGVCPINPNHGPVVGKRLVKAWMGRGQPSFVRRPLGQARGLGLHGLILHCALSQFLPFVGVCLQMHKRGIKKLRGQVD